METRLSVEQFNLRYGTEEDCARALHSLKWPDGYRCSLCGHRQASVILSRRLPLYECRKCRYQASLTVGTIMEKSKTPLRKWFLAIYWMAQGISASQVAKIIHVTYKTAWLIGHKIRHALRLAEGEIRLGNRVYVQEDRYRATSFTGSLSQTLKEQPILAAAALDDNDRILQIKLHQVPASRMPYGRVTKECFHYFVKQELSPDCEPRIIAGYCSSARQRPLVRLCREAFVWLNNTFQGIGPKHLQAYLDHFIYSFRLSAENGALLSDMMHQCAHRPVITYPALTRRLPRPIRFRSRLAAIS